MQKKYFMKQICIKFLRLFALIRTYEISVNIRKYLFIFRISVFPNIRIFPKQSKSKNYISVSYEENHKYLQKPEYPIPVQAYSTLLDYGY